MCLFVKADKKMNIEKSMDISGHLVCRIQWTETELWSIGVLCNSVFEILLNESISKAKVLLSSKEEI